MEKEGGRTFECSIFPRVEFAVDTDSGYTNTDRVAMSRDEFCHFCGHNAGCQARCT